MPANKDQLRRQLLQRRNALSTLEILQLSNQIIAKLQELPGFKAAQTVLSYVSYGTEVNTHGLIRLLLQEKTKVVLVPVVADPRQGTLVLSALDNWDQLSTGAYGILEPTEPQDRGGESVDICLVPGIGFDVQGNRIGYGSGYYDRLLHHIPGITVGLAYDFQVVEAIPNQGHDVPVDLVVTEDRCVARETFR